tara:strand:+ start:60 stop:335 length:276 start_codon:yes stop_codon:yes gene_type:complete
MEDLRNDDTQNYEQAVNDIFTSLCKYVDIQPTRSAETYIATSIAALEYACTVGFMCGVDKEVFDESVENVWKRIQQGKPETDDSDEGVEKG